MANVNRNRPQLAVICGILSLAAACSTSPAPNTPPTAGPSSASLAEQPSDAGELILPIDGYAYTQQQNGVIVLARSVLTGTCMRKFGFSYDLSSDQTTLQQAVQVSVKNLGTHGNKRRYGLTDPATTQKYGYRLPSTVDGGGPSPQPKGAGAHGLPPMTPAMNAVLIGKTESGNAPAPVNGVAVPDGGCVGEATRTLSAIGTVGEIPLVGQIRADSFTRSLSDPAVTAAFKAWSSCMSGKGYRYDSPAIAGDDLDHSSPTVSPREQSVAAADVACKQSTDLVKIWSGFEISYQNKQIDQHAQELNEIKTDTVALIKRAEQIIAAGGK